MFIVVALLSITGCDFDPSQNVHSPTRPDSVTQDGIEWVAIKLAGTSDEWFYAPEEAAVVTHSINPPDGYSFDVLTNGKAWKITCHSDGTYTDDGFETADISANPGLVLFLIVLAGGLILSLVGVASLHETIKKKSKEIVSLELDNRSLRETDRRRYAEGVKLCEALAQEKKDALRVVATEARKVVADRQAVQAERDELEKDKRAMVAASRERQTVKHEPASDDERRNFGRVVRDRLLAGKETNREISVEYTFDPELTGAVVFRWQLIQDRPYPPTLTILRDKTVIRTASSVFNGEFGYWLMKSSKRYKFSFILNQGERRLPDPLVFELTVPALDAWNRRSIPVTPPNVSQDERKRMADAWEAREKQRASDSEKDPVKLKKMFAKIEQERMEKFGEAD